MQRLRFEFNQTDKNFLGGVAQWLALPFCVFGLQFKTQLRQVSFGLCQTCIKDLGLQSQESNLSFYFIFLIQLNCLQKVRKK